MVKIKICGITNLEDYNLIVGHGADYTGFIFYTGSKMCRSSRGEQDNRLRRKGSSLEGRCVCQ